MPNSFTDAIALWLFEPGALAVDSIGTNTFSLKNTPVVDAVGPLEGAGSVRFVGASDQGLYITDANLATGFPLKSGDATKKISICGLLKPNSHANTDGIVVGKWGSQLTFLLDYHGTTGKLSFGWGTSSGATDWAMADFCPLVDGHKYHFGMMIDGVAKMFTFVLYDLTTSTKTVYSHTYGSSLYVGTGDFELGNASSGGNAGFDRWVDELVVFNRLVSEFEVDAIRRGIYSGPINTLAVGSAGVQVLYTDKPSVQVGAVGVTVFYTIPAPSRCLSATACAPLLAAVKPSDCSSHTLCPGLATPRPAGCLSLTACAVCPVYVPPPDSCRSATKSEALAAPPADCRSATRNGAIAPDWVENCRSTTISQSLLLAIPHTCQSRTRSQGIPPFNEGLFLIF